MVDFLPFFFTRDIIFVTSRFSFAQTNHVLKWDLLYREKIGATFFLLV